MGSTLTLQKRMRVNYNRPWHCMCAITKAWQQYNMMIQFKATVTLLGPCKPKSESRIPPIWNLNPESKRFWNMNSRKLLWNPESCTFWNLNPESLVCLKYESRILGLPLQCPTIAILDQQHASCYAMHAMPQVLLLSTFLRPVQVIWIILFVPQGLVMKSHDICPSQVGIFWWIPCPGLSYLCMLSWLHRDVKSDKIPSLSIPA